MTDDLKAMSKNDLVREVRRLHAMLAALREHRQQTMPGDPFTAELSR